MAFSKCSDTWTYVVHFYETDFRRQSKSCTSFSDIVIDAHLLHLENDF